MTRHCRHWCKGDVPSTAGLMRFTLGGLAEISDRLDAPGPGALSRKLRRLDVASGRILLSALLRPTGSADIVPTLSDRDVSCLMPQAAECLRRALS